MPRNYKKLYSYLSSRLISREFVDVWAKKFLKSKKLQFSRLLKKNLISFEFNLRHKFLRNLRPFRMRLPRFRYPWFVRKKKNPRPNARIFFRTLLSRYFIFKHDILPTQNSFLAAWKISKLRKIKLNLGRRLYRHNNLQYFSVGERLPFVKKKPRSYLEKVNLLALRQFYCFKRNAPFKNFWFKIMKRQGGTCYQAGVSSTLLHMFFRTNLFPTTKFCFALIKMGGVLINSKVVTNPYAPLRTYDVLQVSDSFRLLVFGYFLKRVQNKQLLVNIPNFFDYDYRLLYFCVWRPLTVQESSFWFQYPFHRPQVSSRYVKDVSIN